MSRFVERDTMVLVAEILGMCSKAKVGLSLDEITFRVYRNYNDKNRYKVFRVVEALLRQDALVPQFKNNCLCFRDNNGNQK